MMSRKSKVESLDRIYRLGSGVVFMALLTGCLPELEKGTVGTLTQPGVAPGFVVEPDPNSNSNAGSPDQLPPVSTPTPHPDGLPVIDPNRVLTINGGAPFAQSTAVNVAIQYFTQYPQMKLSLNQNCEGGQWEDFSTTGSDQRTMTLATVNEKAYVSVQFTDFDFAMSDCFSSSITVDTLAPEILFQQYPTSSIQEGSGTQIIYDVVDAGVGVESVECSLNEVVQTCAGGRATVQIPALASGNYTFTVRARDQYGLEATKSVSWQVTKANRSLEHRIGVAEYRKWDILFVIDNSGSMRYEQQSMANRTRNFLQILQGLDWQIAVTTTDPSHSTLGDGRLIPLSGLSGRYVLDSTMEMTEAQSVLSQTLQRRETGSGSEQGIRSTYRAVERLAESSVHRQLFRSGAHFAVILISDEDESANNVANDPQNLLGLINLTFDGQKNFLFNSIITVPGDTACKNTHGATYGNRYKTLTELTRGIMGSVCETDYAGQVSGIADQIRNMARTFTLSCLPVAGSNVTVERNGVAVTAPFTVNGLKLEFQQSIEPGEYVLRYQCLAE